MSGTEESYEEQYQKAWDELDAAAEGAKPETTTAEPEKTEEAAPEPEPTTSEETKVEEETVEQKYARLQAEYEKAQKALQDTQRWGHEKAAEAARLKREQEQAKLAQQKPELLASIPELEGAVDHVLAARLAREQEDAEKAQQQYQERFQQNLHMVVSVIPEVPELLKDPDFYAAMEKRREAVGAEKFDLDPALMLREISAEKQARERLAWEAQQQAAIEAARKDAEKQARAKASMAMPGASTGAARTPSAKALTPEDVWNMSEEDFRRMTSKVTGF